MRHSIQLDVLEQLRGLHASGRDQDMLERVAEVDISRYSDADILDLELKSVFRGYPCLPAMPRACRRPAATS